MHTYEYPRPAVTVDIILFTFANNELKVLLVQRKNAPFVSAWALPGGFLEMEEDLETSARRELVEETGVDDVYLEQLYTFGEPERDPRGRVISVAYFGVIGHRQARKLTVRSGDDAADVGWWNVYRLPYLGFDHARIVEYALQRLRWKLEWTTLGVLLLPEEFTLPDLQRVYETVLNRELDKRNFRRKILSATATAEDGSEEPLLEELDKFVPSARRPARLYRFKAKSIELEQLRSRFP